MTAHVSPLVRGLLEAFLADAGYLPLVHADGTSTEERIVANTVRCEGWHAHHSRGIADLIRAAAKSDLALELLTRQRGTLAKELIERLANDAGFDDAEAVHDAVCECLHADDLPARVIRDGQRRARRIIKADGRRHKHNLGLCLRSKEIEE